MTSDALAIANLKAAYCRAADAAPHDPDAAKAMFSGLFTDDFEADYGFRTLQGERAIAAFMIEAIGGGSAWMIHALGSPLIRIEGNTAQADWTVAVDSRRRDGSGLMRIVGRYSDTFRKEADGWRIATIAFERYE